MIQPITEGVQKISEGMFMVIIKRTNGHLSTQGTTSPIILEIFT